MYELFVFILSNSTTLINIIIQYGNFIIKRKIFFILHGEKQFAKFINGYTEYDRLVARRVLPRQVPVARHFNVVVPGVREAD